MLNNTTIYTQKNIHPMYQWEFQDSEMDVR